MKTKKPVPTFEEFWKDVESDASARGTAAVEHLQDLRAAFRLARELVRARRAQGLTQEAVAKLAGIAQADLSRYERGKGNPGVLTLAKLGTVYGKVAITFGPGRRAHARKGHHMQRKHAAKKKKAALVHRQTA